MAAKYLALARARAERAQLNHDPDSETQADDGSKKSNSLGRLVPAGRDGFSLTDPQLTHELRFMCACMHVCMLDLPLAPGRSAVLLHLP